MAQNEDQLTNQDTSYGTAGTYAGKEAATGPNSREIRREIDRTRSEMDETLDALERKLTPGQLFEEGWHLLRGGSSAGASKLWRVAREYPLPSTVIGIGLAWLVTEASRGGSRTEVRYDRAYGGGYPGYGTESYRYGEGQWPSREWEGPEEHSGRLDAAKEAVKDAAGSIQHATGSAVHKVGDAASLTGEKVSHLASSTREGAVHLGYRAKTQARRARLGFWQTLESNPLAVGAGTLALGLLAGLSLPSTRREDELMGETRDHLLEEVKELGQETLEKGKQVATVAADKVREEAEKQNLTPAGVADKVRTVAREVKDAAKEEAKHQDLTAEGVQNRVQQAARETKDRATTPVGEPELAGKK